MNTERVLTVILAGGKGSRLEPLTRDRAKPAVPFGGIYRIIDFALSNCLNSGLKKLQILTQYKAASLDRHINLGWRHLFCRELDEFIDVIPPQQRIDENWYQGTADAVYQNIYSLEACKPDLVLILAGDHIYKMNYQLMIDFHRQSNADLTIATLAVDPDDAREFGVIQSDLSGRITGFEEKPKNPVAMADGNGKCLASMGIYVFNARFLFEQLLLDANLPGSSHDFGKNIIPSLIDSRRVMAFPFQDENKKKAAYWRDVGTLDAYYEANMDLIRVEPELNIYDRQWPIRTWQGNFPPPKFVFADREPGVESRFGHAVDSMVCSGSIISGGSVQRSIIGPNARIHSWADISDSILMEGVEVGRHAEIRNAIIDKFVQIPAGTRIGFDLETDLRNGCTASPAGIVVVGKSGVVNNPGRASTPRFLSSKPQNKHQV